MNSEMILTDKEKELIEAVRNYKTSKHNPSRMLKNYAKQVFNELLREY